MKAKILQFVGISVATNVFALMFFFYYPYISSIIYFVGGIISRIILPDRKFLAGVLAGLPGILLMSCFAWEAAPPFITANLLVIYSLVLVPAILGSLFGMSIYHRLRKSFGQA